MSAQALRAALSDLRKLAVKWAYGEMDNWEDHGEDCPASNEDAHTYQEHEAKCAVSPGARIDLVKKPGVGWLVWPDVECCDPETLRDEDAMREACDCSVGANEELLRLVNAAIAAEASLSAGEKR